MACCSLSLKTWTFFLPLLPRERAIRTTSCIFPSSRYFSSSRVLSPTSSERKSDSEVRRIIRKARFFNSLAVSSQETTSPCFDGAVDTTAARRGDACSTTSSTRRTTPAARPLLITSPDDAAQVCFELMSHAAGAEVAFDCEGVALGRFGRLCLLQVAAEIDVPDEENANGVVLSGGEDGKNPVLSAVSTPAAHDQQMHKVEDGVVDEDVGVSPTAQFLGFRKEVKVFLFDALVPGVIEALRPLLEAHHIVKVAHDCREDLSALHHQFGIAVAPVFDTQLAQLMQDTDAQLGQLREQVFSLPTSAPMLDEDELHTAVVDEGENNSSEGASGKNAEHDLHTAGNNNSAQQRSNTTTPGVFLQSLDALFARYLHERSSSPETESALSLRIGAQYESEPNFWFFRPLSPDAQEYAANDVRHLLEVKKRLLVAGTISSSSDNDVAGSSEGASPRPPGACSLGRIDSICGLENAILDRTALLYQNYPLLNTGLRNPKTIVRGTKILAMLTSRKHGNDGGKQGTKVKIMRKQV